jgi:hypothetical protein
MPTTFDSILFYLTSFGCMRAGRVSLLSVTDVLRATEGKAAQGLVIAIHSLLKGAAGLYEGAQGYLILQMILCRTVDNFLTYLTDLLVLIFRARPETMRSKETEMLKDVLQFSEMSDLVSYLADKRVMKLAFQSFDDLAKDVEKRTGLPISTDHDTLRYIAIAIEIRNLIVHNRGRVNRRFQDRMKKLDPTATQEAIGHEFVYSYRGILELIQQLESAVRNLDPRAATKSGLPLPCKRADVLPTRVAFVL